MLGSSLINRLIKFYPLRRKRHAVAILPNSATGMPAHMVVGTPTMRTFYSIVIWLFLVSSYSQAAERVTTEKVGLPVKLDGIDTTLETEIVSPSESGKHPLILIVNGSALSPRTAKAEWLDRIAQDFAQKGYVAASILWPGYGSSTGMFRDDGGNCSNPRVASFFKERVEELSGALADLRKRDDVDPNNTLGLGFSIGGASMLALAAQPDHPLKAVINISGGLYHYNHSGDAVKDCQLFRQDLIHTVSKYGSDTRVPTLWIYAANDPFFPPEIARQMVESYRNAGGLAQFIALPPFEKNGHTLFKYSAAPIVNPQIDSFLAKNSLLPINRWSSRQSN